MRGKDLFDNPMQYDEMLHSGIKLTGERKLFFVHKRIEEVRLSLPAEFQPKAILDFGCGIGDTSEHLSKVFSEAEVYGVDISKESITYAQQFYLSKKLHFMTNDDLFDSKLYFDLCYINGVFHHVSSQRYSEVLSKIKGHLSRCGIIAIFENNPLNPGTHFVMSRIPFDKGCKMLSHRKMKQILISSGFTHLKIKFLFYFPHFLRFLRPLERYLKQIPFGGQYFLMGICPD